jgi:hypothetical protein
MPEGIVTRPIKVLRNGIVDTESGSVDNQLAVLAQRLCSTDGVQMSVWKEVFAIIRKQERRITQLENMNNR